MNDDSDVYLVSIFGLIGTQFFESWLGVAMGLAALTFTLIRIVKEFRRWNYDKQRRLEEKDKREEEKQKRELEKQR